MAKRLIPLILLVFMLCGCIPAGIDPVFVPNPPVATTAPTTTPTTVPSTSTNPTTPTHSALWLPDVDVEDVITYFNEVCLDAEVTNSGDPSLLQKWVAPIYYTLNGDYTQEDLAVLEDFCAWLNTIDGFPGIQKAPHAFMTNLRIDFCSARQMHNILGSWTQGLDGAVTFWYQENEIYEGQICIRTDLSQSLRNSVILEELYNGLGPVQDTTLRSDSLIYAGYSEPQTPTDVDALLLKLLYHPRMECGMDAQECESVIRTLYQ